MVVFIIICVANAMIHETCLPNVQLEINFPFRANVALGSPMSEVRRFLNVIALYFSGRRLEMNNDVSPATGGSMFASTIIMEGHRLFSHRDRCKFQTDAPSP